ncbi:hypothetical protein D3C80_1430720 [compost metagenome]
MPCAIHCWWHSALIWRWITRSISTTSSPFTTNAPKARSAPSFSNGSRIRRSWAKRVGRSATARCNGMSIRLTARRILPVALPSGAYRLPPSSVGKPLPAWCTTPWLTRCFPPTSRLLISMAKGCAPAALQMKPGRRLSRAIRSRAISGWMGGMRRFPISVRLSRPFRRCAGPAALHSASRMWRLAGQMLLRASASTPGMWQQPSSFSRMPGEHTSR